MSSPSDLGQGDRVKYRSLGDDRDGYGIVRKVIHILTASLDPVAVYVVDSDDGDVIILGDGEMLGTVSQTV